MNATDRFDSLIQFYAAKYGLDWRIVKKQMLAESGGNPTAESPVGAQGLMQFMPATWKEFDDEDKLPVLDHPFNPEENIEAGCKYLAHLFSCFGEIPDQRERYKFALAAYNCGRDNLNQALEHARKACGAPMAFKDWVESGRPTGPWQRWDFASRFLSLVTGEHARETLGYVRKIMEEV